MKVKLVYVLFVVFCFLGMLIVRIVIRSGEEKRQDGGHGGGFGMRQLEVGVRRR
ncbi:hypothetical protein BH11PAT4_BH11PAT4_6480 [soil metagenome]